MPRPFKVTRLYADAEGETHFDEIEFDMSSIQYAPPAPALDISEPIGVTKVFWMRFPEGWNDDAHPSPRRQLFIVLEGELEGRTSDGQTKIFKPGDRLLGEDTSGKGHGTRALNGEALAVVIALE